MLSAVHHLRGRPSLMIGLAVLCVVALVAATRLRPMTAVLVGWDAGVVAYCLRFALAVRRTTPEQLAAVAAALDEGRIGVLIGTVVAALASLGAIVVELAQAHGKPDAGWSGALAAATVVLSWVFIHAIYATHYAHSFWRDGSGLHFPGNKRPDYGEFLYFSFCIAVASQVSDVSTQSAAMRRIVTVHSLIAYLFNAAVIALGVNIAASLAS